MYWLKTANIDLIVSVRHECRLSWVSLLQVLTQAALGLVGTMFLSEGFMVERFTPNLTHMVISSIQFFVFIMWVMYSDPH